MPSGKCRLEALHLGAHFGRAADVFAPGELVNGDAGGGWPSLWKKLVVRLRAEL
jgi:hypothetical protein